MFKISPDKENRYRNHFSLPDDQRELFEDLNDIDLRSLLKVFSPSWTTKLSCCKRQAMIFKKMYMYI